MSVRDCGQKRRNQKKHTKPPDKKETRRKRILCVSVFTVFVTCDRNVVDGSQFEAGAGQNLELDRT